MKDILAEYRKIYKSFDYANVDQSAAHRHIKNISLFADETQNAIAIHDNIEIKPIYTSKLYQEFFGENDWNAIHPDDQKSLLKSSVAALHYFFNGNKNIKDHVLVRKYRAKIKGTYCVIIEQVKALEFDTKGNVWLSLVIVTISPNQSPPYSFESKVFNTKTGDIITPIDEYFDGSPILSERELDVLRLVEKGFLSKEISEKLSISLHTVNTHRQRILKKLKVGTSIEAIKYASAIGIL